MRGGSNPCSQPLAHPVAAVLLDHHAAGEGLVVRFNEERPLLPIQDVSLHEDHVLHTCDLQERDSRGVQARREVGARGTSPEDCHPRTRETPGSRPDHQPSPDPWISEFGDPRTCGPLVPCPTPAHPPEPGALTPTPFPHLRDPGTPCWPYFSGQYPVSAQPPGPPLPWTREAPSREPAPSTDTRVSPRLNPAPRSPPATPHPGAGPFSAGSPVLQGPPPRPPCAAAAGPPRAAGSSAPPRAPRHRRCGTRAGPHCPGRLESAGRWGSASHRPGAEGRGPGECQGGRGRPEHLLPPPKPGWALVSIPGRVIQRGEGHLPWEKSSDH